MRKIWVIDNRDYEEYFSYRCLFEFLRGCVMGKSLRLKKIVRDEEKSLGYSLKGKIWYLVSLMGGLPFFVWREWEAVEAKNSVSETHWFFTLNSVFWTLANAVSTHFQYRELERAGRAASEASGKSGSAFKYLSPKLVLAFFAGAATFFRILSDRFLTVTDAVINKRNVETRWVDVNCTDAYDPPISDLCQQLVDKNNNYLSSFNERLFLFPVFSAGLELALIILQASYLLFLVYMIRAVKASGLDEDVVELEQLDSEAVHLDQRGTLFQLLGRLRKACLIRDAKRVSDVIRELEKFCEMAVDGKEIDGVDLGALHRSLAEARTKDPEEELYFSYLLEIFELYFLALKVSEKEEVEVEVPKLSISSRPAVSLGATVPEAGKVDDDESSADDLSDGGGLQPPVPALSASDLSASALGAASSSPGRVSVLPDDDSEPSPAGVVSCGK